eukprot:11256519-Alexandrium_andersonii.AAC.1
MARPELDQPRGPRNCGRGMYLGEGKCSNPLRANPNGPGRRSTIARCVSPATAPAVAQAPPPP